MQNQVPTATRRTSRILNGAHKDYSPDELEFMLALERYKRERGRAFPTCCEVLAVAKSLGYRKGE